MNTDDSPMSVAFLRHQRELHQFLLRKVNCSDTAADLLHDTFLQALQYPAQAQVINQRAFLYRVANNLALDFLRKQSRWQVNGNEPLEEDWPCQRPPSERFVDGIQQWQAVEACLRDLPLLSRQIIYLCQLEGKSHQQIASELQVTTRHIEHSLRRTRKFLAEAVSK